MSNEQDKGKVELAVFNEFTFKAGISVDQASISKSGLASEPDIFCTLTSGEQVAYELVEICASDIAAAITKIKKGGVASVITADPTGKIIRQKMRKNYKTNRPIELLCYTNGRTVTPDEVILNQAQLWANATDGPFRKIWLLGERDVYLVWSHT